MGFLDGGFLGGSQPATIQTQSATSAPWAAAQPYVKEIMAGAQEAYKGAAPSYFPESTVVGFSPQSEQGLQMIENRALSGSPIQQAGMAEALKTIQGGYLEASPFLTGALQSAYAPLIDEWSTSVAPGIDSTFSGGGRFGSGLYAQSRNRSEDALARAMADTTAGMAYQDYGAERGRQGQMAMAAPSLAQADYADIQQLMGVGGAREGLETARLKDRMDRFNFEQNRPWEQLARYSGMIGGGFGTETTQATPLYTNPAANFLGGALGGAQLGTMAGVDPMLGAVGGGLLGMLG